MTRISNIGRVPVHLTLGARDGEAIVEAIMPGETKSVRIAADHQRVVARANAGLIAVEPAARAQRSRSLEASKS